MSQSLSVSEKPPVTKCEDTLSFFCSYFPVHGVMRGILHIRYKLAHGVLEEIKFRHFRFFNFWYNFFTSQNLILLILGALWMFVSDYY